MRELMRDDRMMMANEIDEHGVMGEYDLGRMSSMTNRKELHRLISLVIRDTWKRNDNSTNEKWARIKGAVHQGVRDQHNMDISGKGLNMYYDGKYFGEVSMLPLDEDKVKEARCKEMVYFEKMNVFSRVPRHVAQKTGPIIPIKWVDTDVAANWEIE